MGELHYRTPINSEKNKKQECWPRRNFLFGKGALHTNFSTEARLFLIFCLAIVPVSPVVYILNPKRERKCILRYKSTSSNSVYLFEIISDCKAVFYVGLPCTFRIDFQRRYTCRRWGAAHVAWWKQETKEKLTTAASVDKVYLWWHGTIKHELLTATRTAEVVCIVHYISHVDAWRDLSWHDEKNPCWILRNTQCTICAARSTPRRKYAAINRKRRNVHSTTYGSHRQK